MAQGVEEWVGVKMVGMGENDGRNHGGTNPRYVQVNKCPERKQEPSNMYMSLVVVWFFFSP